MSFNQLALTDSLTSLTVLLFSLVALWHYSNKTALAAMSLPALMLLTSLLYFFVMPILTIGNSGGHFFGVHIDSLSNLHLAVLLYSIGGILAFLPNSRLLQFDPARSTPTRRATSVRVISMFGAAALLGTAILIARGTLTLLGNDTPWVDSIYVTDQLGFLKQTYNLVIPITLLVLVRSNFSLWSLAILACVLFIFLQAGSRYRILIVVVGAATSYALINQKRITLIPALIAASLGVLALNFIGVVRRYGAGADFTAARDVSIAQLATDFRGEVGTVYAFHNTVSTPLPPPIGFEPWAVGIARLVPSALWPDKPTAEHLAQVAAYMPDPNADFAGIVAPQHVEILYQFGWEGLPVLAFMYFGFAMLLTRMIRKLDRDSRVVGFALIPAFFGYYMQSRGYFAQILSDGIFIFVPLFAMQALSQLFRPTPRNFTESAHELSQPRKGE